MKPFLTILLMALCALLCGAAVADAASTGAVRGTVTSAEGDSLAGVNVIVEGTKRGATTDLNGWFVIMGLSPGDYTLTFRSLGYRPHVVKEVQVGAGRTTSLNVTLESDTLSFQPVTVVYEPPPVNLRESGQQWISTGSEVRELPLMNAVDAMTYQAGVVSGGAGRLHLRGGMANEVAYIIDGLRVDDLDDPLTSFEVGRLTLHETQLVTGTFSVEYGEAMSGLLEVTTREGGDRFGASVEYISPMLNPSPFRKADWWGTDALRDGRGSSLYEESDRTTRHSPPVGLPGQITIALSGPMPFVPRTSVFVSAGQRLENSYLPWGDIWQRDLSGKLTHTVGRGKLTLSAARTWRDGQEYDHVYKYDPDRYHTYSSVNDRISLGWTQHLHDRLLLEVIAGYTAKQADAKPFADWKRYWEMRPLNWDDITTLLFVDPAVHSQWSTTWYERDWSTRTVKPRLTWELDPSMSLLVGGEFREEDISMDQVSITSFADYRRFMDVTAPYPASQVFYLESNQASPRVWAAYTQAHVEYQDFIADAGMRIDQIDPDVQVWVYDDNRLPRARVWEERTYLSPRVGVAHSLSETSTLQFNYGRFYQYPDFDVIAANRAEFGGSRPNEMGMPDGSEQVFEAHDLEPQRTTSYEVGLKQRLGDTWGAVVTVYYKDIYNLRVTQLQPQGYSGYDVMVYSRRGMTNSKGVELTLNKAFRDHWSMQFTYTWSQAFGDAAPTTYSVRDYAHAIYGHPVTDTLATGDQFLEHDRRHVVNAMLTWRAGRSGYPRLFGTALLKGVGVGVLLNAASGLPYEYLEGYNSTIPVTDQEWMAGTWRVDLRVAKTLLFEPVRATLFLTVDNLFDRRNPRVVDIETGEAWETTENPNWREYHDWVHDPQRVDAPRIVRLGVTLEY